MKKIFFILIILFWCKVSFAQISIERQVISSTGNLTNAGTIKSFSNIGEVIIPTFSQPTLVVTQGFEQPDEISETVGVDNISSKNEISIFPNPVGNILNLEFQYDKNEKIKIEMINLLGQVVFDKDFQTQNGKNTFTLEVNKLPKGVYIVKVDINDSFITKLIIKE